MDGGRVQIQNLKKQKGGLIMTLSNFILLLDIHGIPHEKFTSISVKILTSASREIYDIVEIIDAHMYLNGSPNFNVWQYLGY